MIRKRMCELPYITSTNTHILPGKRYTENEPPINLKIGECIPIRVIQIPGLVTNSNVEIDPIFIDNTCNVRVVNIYEKRFEDLKEHDLDGLSPIMKNDLYILSLYLSLIYNKCIDDIVTGYVTIVNTTRI